MKSTMQYSVGGDIIDVADDRRDEFFADYAKDYDGAEPEEVYTYWVNGEPVQVKASRVDEFLADCEADKVTARKTRAFQMDDGEVLRLDDNAVGQLVQSRRVGAGVSRGMLKQTGIPEQYGRSAAEREALADAFGAYYAEDKGPDYEGEGYYHGEKNAGDILGDVAGAVGKGAEFVGDVAKRTGENLVFAPGSEWDEWLQEQEGALGNAIRGANDFSNKAAQAVADVPAAVNDVAAGLVGAGERLAGGDGELEQKMRGNSAAYRKGVQEQLPTDTAELDGGLKKASDFVGNTLVTIGKFAVPGMAPVAISADTINSYYDAYEQAKENGASDDKAEALAAAKSGATAAMGLVLGKAAKGARSARGFVGTLTDMAVTGGEMGALGGINDVIDQEIEYGNREYRNDGETKKGTGWLGRLKTSDGGVATEYSVGVNIDGQEMDIPTLVPTLTDDEISLMVNDIIPNRKPIPDAIMQKAADHAKSQLAKGESVFTNDAGIDWVRVAKAAGKEAAQGAAFSWISRGVHAIAGAGERSAAKEARRTAQERAEAERKENARTEARENYEANLSDEARSDIDAVVGDMIKTEVIPSWRQAEEVRQKAIEKLGGRERGESHEAVEQAVMEAAHEVQERLQTPTRVTSDALERRQTEAKARDSEYWAKRSDELAEQYGAEEAARKVAEEKAAVERKNAAEEAAQGEHAEKQAEIEAAFADMTAEAKPDGKGKMVKAEPKVEIGEEMRGKIAGDAKMQDIMKRAREAKDETEKAQLQAEWNKRWRELEGGETSEAKPVEETQTPVIEKPVEALKRVDKTGEDGRKVELVLDEAEKADFNGRHEWYEANGKKFAVRRGEDFGRGNQWVAVDGEGNVVGTGSTEDSALANGKDWAYGIEKAPDGKGKMVERPVERPADGAAGAEPAAPAMDAKAAAKVLGTDAYLPEEQLEAKLAQWEQHKDDPRAAKMAEAAKAMLADRAAKGAKPAEVDKGTAETDKGVIGIVEKPVFVYESPLGIRIGRQGESLSDSEMTIVSRILKENGIETGYVNYGTGLDRGFLEKPKATGKNVFGLKNRDDFEKAVKILDGINEKIHKSKLESSNEPTTVSTPTQTAKVPDGKGRMVEKAAETPVETSATKNGRTVAKKVVKPQEAPKAASTPTDAGFAAWAVGRDGKPMEFATEADRKRSYAEFEREVAKGKIDGATGKPIEGGAESATPANAEQAPEPKMDRVKWIDADGRERRTLPDDFSNPTKENLTAGSYVVVRDEQNRNLHEGMIVSIGRKKITIRSPYMRDITTEVEYPIADVIGVSQHNYLSPEQMARIKSETKSAPTAAKPVEAAKLVPDGKGKMKVAAKKVEAKPTDEKNGIRVTKRDFGNYDVEIDKDGVTHNFQIRKNAKTGEYSIVDANGDIVSTVGKHDAFESKEEIVNYLKDEAKTFVDGDYTVVESHAQRVAEKKTKAYADEIGKMKHLSESDKKAFEKLSREYEEAFTALRVNKMNEEDIKSASVEDLPDYGIEKGTDNHEVASRFIEARDALERFHEQAKKYNGLKRDRKTGRPLLEPETPAVEQGKTIEDSVAELDRIIAEEEAGGAKGGASNNGGAEGLPKRSWSWKPGSGVKGKGTSKNAIIRKAKELFPEFAIRGENTTKIGANYAGHWEPWREVIRSKDKASLDTIPHEIGHGIDSLTRKTGLVMPQDVKRDLVKYGRQLYGNKKPNGGYMGEGFAEYVRGYLCGQGETLANEVPALHKWFTETFKEKHPEYVKRLDKLAEEVTHYRAQTAVQEMKAFLEPETTVAQRVKNTIKRVFSQEVWNDEGATLDKGMKNSGLDTLYRWQDKFKEAEEALKAGDTARAKSLADEASRMIEDDPRIYAANNRGTAKARVVDMLQNGISNLTGNKRIGNLVLGADGLPQKNADGSYKRDNVTESYADIFKGFTKKELSDWDAYAAAKVGLENYAKNGKEYGLSTEKLESVVKQLETPKFEDALLRFTKFQDRMMSLMLEAGAISPESYKALTSHKYYVRTERRFEDDGVDVGGGKQGSPLNKIKGSSRNIMNPRTASLMQMERLMQYAQQMKLLNLITKSVVKGEALNTAHENKNGGYSGRTFHIGANMPIKVSNAKEGVKFSSEKIKEDFIKRAARHYEDSGEADPSKFTVSGRKILSEAEDMAMKLYESMYGEEGDTLQFFREAPSKGKNGLVSTYVDGKLYTVEIPDGEWAKYFTGFNGSDAFNSKVGNTFWKIATAPAKTLRLGATGLKAAFQTANIVRDTKNAAVNSETGFIPGISSAKGLVDEVRGTDNAKMFGAMGGKMANLSGSNAEGQWRRGASASLEKNVLKRIVADTDAKHPVRSALGVLNESLNTVEDALGVFETAARTREFDAVMKKAKGAGLSDDAAASLAFAAGKDISLDFGKHGSAMKRINQIVPFTNAAYRGIEQMARKFGLIDSLPTEFNGGKGLVRAVAEKDAQGVKDAAKRGGKTVAKSLLWITAGEVATSIARMLTMDDDEKYAEFKKEKNEKWGYDDVLGVRIPQSYDYGAIFGSIPKAIVYEAFGDKGAVDEAMEYALERTFASGKPQEIVRGIALISPVIDIMRNRKWNESPIVSPITMERFPKNKEEWSDYATTKVAKEIGEAFDWAPAYVDHIVNSYTGGAWNRWLSPAADNSFMTLTGLSTFRQRPTARRDVNEFYEERERLTSVYNKGSATPAEAGKLKRANKLAEDLRPDFKEARELNNSSLSADERRKKREEIMNRVYDKIRKFNESTANDTTAGIAKAANSLIDGAVNNADTEKYRKVLRDVPLPTIEAALIDYGREIVETEKRNKMGYKTGRVEHRRRWTNETIRERIVKLRRAMAD